MRFIVNRTPAEQALYNEHERKIFEKHVVAIFSGFLATVTVVVIAYLAAAALLMHWFYR